MRSAASFVREIHRRAALLRRKYAKRQILLLTAVNVCLLVSLCVMIGTPHRIARTAFAGTSLLDDSVGGYVAVAVLSFMLGVAVTFFMREYLKKKTARKSAPEDKNKET